MSSFPAWIEQDPFLFAVARRLRSYQPRRLSLPGFIQAAVLLLVWRQQHVPHLLFIRRSDRVRQHKGEISFPGGTWEPRDKDLSHTAIRETHEELGIPPHELSLIGRLDDAFSFTRYAIAPYVAAIRTPHPLRPSEEVAEPIPMPVSRFFKPDRFSVTDRNLDDKRVPTYTYELDGRVIWGATARILKGFLDLLQEDEALLKALHDDTPAS